MTTEAIPTKLWGKLKEEVERVSTAQSVRRHAHNKAWSSSPSTKKTKDQVTHCPCPRTQADTQAGDMCRQDASQEQSSGRGQFSHRAMEATEDSFTEEVDLQSVRSGKATSLQKLSLCLQKVNALSPAEVVSIMESHEDWKEVTGLEVAALHLEATQGGAC